MNKIFSLCIFAVAACQGTWAADSAAPADELARAKTAAALAVPEAPEGYRRPADWKPVLFAKDLHQIAKDHSVEVMARAKAQMEKVNAVNAAGKYKATGASMDAHPCPEWFLDAKLGMFIDWGLWSVASWCPYVKGARLYPDWYEYRCRPDYQDPGGKTSAVAYHRKNWGADFMPDHFIDLFRGTRFDAPKLTELFKECGAKYVIPFLKHHSGFCLWDCSYTFRDTMDQGAHRDFAQEMADACRAQGLKFGVYNSQAGEWEYPILQDDGSIRMLMNGVTLQDYSSDMEWKCSGKVAVKDFVHDYIVPQMTEFVDKYDPDILWYDFDWQTFAHANGSYEITAYLYNKAEGRKEVACNDRYGKARPEEIEGRFTKIPREWLRTVRGDYYTDEWGDTAECLDPAKWHPWESCSGISKSYGNHWMENFDPSMVMTEKEFIVHFTGIVARGGCLLLLVNLDPQGALPKVQEERLRQIGAWLKTYGEAIFATRICAPFSTPAIDYTQAKDHSAVYAIVKEPATEIVLTCDLPEGAVVTLVGTDRRLEANRTAVGLTVKLPSDLATAKLPFALKCTPALSPNTGEVWYIPGWLRTADTNGLAYASCTNTFAGTTCRFRGWDGDCNWWAAAENADKEGIRLAEEIAATNAAFRSGLTLVGHSLGGRVIAHALAHLAKKGVKIRQGILLAPAIPMRDPDVPLMGGGCELPALVVVNPKDTVLKYIYTVSGAEAPSLGADGTPRPLANVAEYGVPHDITEQTEVPKLWGKSEHLKRLCNHLAPFYFTELAKILAGVPSADVQVRIVQDKINLEWKTIDAGVWWNVKDVYRGWKLERNIVTGHYRILNPEKKRVAWGGELEMRASFGKIKAQLK